MEQILYLDKSEKERSWESVSRRYGKGAVLIIPLMKPSNQLVLIRQFRPPTGGYVIEFPAGLIDDGESPHDSVLRELREECGLKGKIIRVTNQFFSSPGLSSETVAIALVYIDEKHKESFVNTDFDDSEDIETFFVPFEDIPKFLAEREEKGDRVDAKLATASLFIELITSFNSKFFT
ncbi:MAG TPA: NUDIX hydrolase [Victivallales bacterium]|nr:NUDIX hydrolase [Victivallales bacterium]